MGYYCTVPQCTSLAGKTKNVKFHRFPRDVTMADRWNVILKRGKPYTKYSKVCSLHFTQADYNVTTMGQWKTLSKDAVPSQNLPKLNPDGSVMVIRKSRTVKYREGRKDESHIDKSDKWIAQITHTPAPNTLATSIENHPEAQDSNIAYRLQALSAIASNLPPQPPVQPQPQPQPLPQPQTQLPLPQKPKKQDAFMQTDPVPSEEDDTQPNNSYSETSDNSFNSEHLDYSTPYKDTKTEYPIPRYEDKKMESPKDYTKQENDYNKEYKDDYIPQTNEEYNKEAEKYALERKSHNGYEKIPDGYQKPNEYQKVIENGYQKMQDLYGFAEKEYQRNQNEYPMYQNGYHDSAEILRNQQHNLQMLQEQHRVAENQNFFNDNPIKQEVDLNDEEKFLYERTKDQLDSNTMYGGHRTIMQQQRLLEHLQHQVKQEPDASACEGVMQPQGSPYYATNSHNNVTGTYYDQISRPGPELLIAKQNALAAHTQLWQNTMKRPFFYSESPHYASPQLLQRYTEDLTRILQ